MRVTRELQGHVIELELDEIKEYPRHTLYQVSKIVNGVKVPIRQESFTKFQMAEIVKNGYRLPGDKREYHIIDIGVEEFDEEIEGE